MRRIQRSILSFVLVAAAASYSSAQPRPNLTLARVIYNTLKTTAKPQGELKEKIDAIDREIAEAARLGRSGEVRRLLAKGTTLLQGREWDDVREFSTSLVLRSESVFVDSARPYSVRLEQIYAPRVEIRGSMTARLSLHKLQRVGRLAQPGEKIRDLATIEGVARDLLDEPCRVDLELSAVADGSYALQVEFLEKERSLGRASLAIEAIENLDARLRKIESEWKRVRGFDAVRADVFYPLDFIGKVNRGLIEIGTFDVGKELAASEQILASLLAGNDPFAGRKGDMERHYLLEGANEIMPYRVYVPARYTVREPFPLIIALHGLGANEDSFFDSYGKQFPKLAEERGYIVAAPLGYRVDGAYGANLFRATDDVALQRKLQYSEKDVMTVLELMKRDYRIDESRIYLAGHSMGAIGTWYLGAKYAETWAGLAPFAGFGSPETVEKMKHIPQIVVHGDADATVPVGGSRAMVAKLKELGVVHQYIEVPGGSHIDVVMPNFPAVFDFFDRHRKKTY